MCILQRTSCPLRLPSYTRSCYRGLPGNCSLLISSPDLLESSTSPTTAIFHFLCRLTRPFHATLLPQCSAETSDWCEESLVWFWTVWICSSLRSTTASWLVKIVVSSMSVSFTLACVYKRRDKVRRTADSVCP